MLIFLATTFYVAEGQASWAEGSRPAGVLGLVGLSFVGRVRRAAWTQPSLPLVRP